MENLFQTSKQDVSVGIGDMKIARGDDHTITTYALGSCVGITFYDPGSKIGALLHVQLPEKHNPNDRDDLKYADTGVAMTVDALTVQGFNFRKAIVKIAGGARMFGNATGPFGSIGEQNIINVKKALMAEGLHICAEDVGGTFARTMSIDLGSGDVVVRAVGKEPRHL